MQGPILIENLRVEFPYVPYECQRSFMSKVVAALNASSNAALESPTGTGKTLSLLCASIAWLQAEKQRLKPQIIGDLIKPENSAKISESTGLAALYPKIFYASRTHSQLQQVVRELNKTPYKSVIKVATLAGRNQLCINERVMKESNNEVKGHLCRTLVKNRKCHYYNKLEKDEAVIEDMYRNESEDALDIEDLVTAAKKFRHCPFYRSRQMDREADLILLPYNYILDPKTREAYDVKLRGNILIFDEAHNLEAIAEESVSISITTKTLALSIEECKRVLELIFEEEENIRTEMDNSTVTFSSLMSGRSKCEQMKKDNSLPNKNDVSMLLSRLHSLSDGIADADFKAVGGKPLGNQEKMKGFILPGQYLIGLLERAEFTKANRVDVCCLIDRMGVFLANCAEKSSIWEESGGHLSEFASFLTKVFVDTFEGIEHVEYAGKFQKSVKFTPTSKADSYSFFKVFVVPEGERIRINYWCFSAGVAMRFLQSRGVRSIILTSGTLAPLPQFIAVMAIPFEHTLENTHVAHSNQLIVGALARGRGVDGADIRGNYKRSAELSYKMSIGDLLVQTARVTPQGVLAFFPSYGKMNECIKCWKETKSESDGLLLWSLLERYKRVFVEPSDKTQLAAEFCAFDAAIRGEGVNSTQSGALFLAVCRGKLSEGIDFADSHSRAVFIVGLPLPPFYNERVLLKKEFLLERHRKDSSFMNPNVWYELEGYRAVNQALGRVIRHKDDFGAVVLADARYASLESKRKFPAWICSSVAVYDNPNALFEKVQRFFEERGMLVERSRERLVAERATAAVEKNGGRKRKHIQWADDAAETRQQNLINDLFDAYGGAMREKCGIVEGDGCCNGMSTSESSGEIKVLNNVLNIVTSLPDSSKSFQRNLQLCDNVDEYSQRAFDRLAAGNGAGQIPVPKRRIKLKANVKVNAQTDPEETAVAANIRRLQERHLAVGDADRPSPISPASDDNITDSQLLRSMAMGRDQRPLSLKFEKPTLLMKQSVTLKDRIAAKSLKPLTPGDGKPLIRFDTISSANAETTDGLMPTTIVKSILKNSVNSLATAAKKSGVELPPILSVEEYQLLINNLERMKKLRLIQAQKVYLQTKQFDVLMEALRTIALPNDPLIFTGFHTFLQDEHKSAHIQACRSLKLL